MAQGSATVRLLILGEGISSAIGVSAGNLAEASAQTRKTNRANRTTIMAARVHFGFSAIAESGTLLILKPLYTEYERECDWLAMDVIDDPKARW